MNSDAFNELRGDALELELNHGIEGSDLLVEGKFLDLIFSNAVGIKSGGDVVRHRGAVELEVCQHLNDLV